tara:strand:+ start:243 stop:503 length:261 start_codon:yes stop_codon:yes gene_type:complete
MNNNKLVDNLILSLNQEINVYKHLLNKELDKREKLESEDMYFDETTQENVISSQYYEIDLEIEYLKGSIGVSQHIMQLIKENTDNL